MEQNVPVNEGAEAFVELLIANGVDYIFLNPGSGSSSIQEALAKFEAQSRKTPRVILCLNEFVAMTAAHGHFLVSKKPQVVLVHETLGTQQLGGAIHNAERNRIGVVLCATRVPRNNRQGSLQWLEERFDPAGVVREYVKWYYELRTNENMEEVIQRAFQVASSEPCGPVYLTLPVDLLLEKMDKLTVPDVTRHSATVTPQADAVALQRAAKILIDAENPLIITGYVGRNHETVASLVELAETLGARVITTQRYLNFPTTHPLYCGLSPETHLKNADAVLNIDVDIPYVPVVSQPPSRSKIIYIDMDTVKPRIPLWHFPVDEFIQADSGKAIPVLIGKIRQLLTVEQKANINARFQKIQKEHQLLLDNWQKLAMEKASASPISAEWLSRCINDAIDEDTIVIEETITSRLPVLRQLQRTRPGTFFTSEAASLGWSPGAAFGVKLARPEATVVSLIGDGGFNFSCPTSVLWAAYAFKAPFLCVIFNNREYYVPKMTIQKRYGDESFSQKTGNWIGIDIEPSPDYAAIARACHCYGETVENPSDIPRALKIALEQVYNGKPAVLDVIIKKL